MKTERTTRIEWAQHTWNPIAGCSIMSAGCTNCYAMRQAHRIEKMGFSPTYQGLTKVVNGKPVWTGQLRRATKAVLATPFRLKEPSVIFVNSMSDLFHPDAPDEWRDEAFWAMEQNRRHRFQILTKRPDVAARYYETRRSARELSHVWLGVSVERADVRWRIDALRDIPARTRFLSVEPLIGPVGDMTLDGIHWVITGGESGPGARPMEPAWLREARDQSMAAGVPFFHKQFGHWRNNPLVCEQGMSPEEAQRHDLDPEAKGGATLDGLLWRQMPDGVGTKDGRAHAGA